MWDGRIGNPSYGESGRFFPRWALTFVHHDLDQVSAGVRRVVGHGDAHNRGTGASRTGTCSPRTAWTAACLSRWSATTSQDLPSSEVWTVNP